MPILEERYQRLLQHSVAAGVAEIEAFVKGELAHAGCRSAVIHAAVGAMKDIKRRADFEVYLKKFLQSLNLILPNPAGHLIAGLRGVSATCCAWSRNATRTIRSTSPMPARR